jgi:S-(hydroxymethyl)glutathione dehydrogenase / alcohol dehydrogenase
VDLDDAKLRLAQRMGATCCVNASSDDAVSVAKRESCGRGADTVIEAAGSGTAFRTSAEAVRPGGEIIWLGKIDVEKDVAFRWGALMQEKRIRRSSYGDARPWRDFPLLAQAYLEGRLLLDELITQRIRLPSINDGFAALRSGRAIRTVVTFD